MFNPERLPMIRPAGPNDATKVAVLLVDAMKELAVQYANDPDPYRAIPIFERFVAQDNNQYSYQNMLVYCLEEEVVGVINGYDGKRFSDLRSPFLSYLHDELQITIPDEAETAAGEYYIDALSVSSDYQGKGIGKKLILHLIENAKEEGFEKIGLLVGTDNDDAKRLYESLGFSVVGVKHLLGEHYHHLQLTA
jgi:ribosomal protein S18 acetylase RimI-like enzyme